MCATAWPAWMGLKPPHSEEYAEMYFNVEYIPGHSTTLLRTLDALRSYHGAIDPPQCRKDGTLEESVRRLNDTYV